MNRDVDYPSFFSIVKFFFADCSGADLNYFFRVNLFVYSTHKSSMRGSEVHVSVAEIQMRIISDDILGRVPQ